MYTSNPKYEPPRQIVASFELSEIEYPSFDVIKMKNDSNNGSYNNNTNNFNYNRPFVPVDRSNKPIYVKPADKMKMMNKIIAEKEELTEKALQDEREALKLASDLDKTVREEPKDDNNDEMRKWYETQDKLEYKLLEFENKQSDNVSLMFGIESNIIGIIK